MSSIARRAGTKLVWLLDRAVDPVAAAAAQLYALAGELYVRSGGGVINKMTGPNAVTPTGWIDGGQLTRTSAAQVTIAPALARDSTDVIDLLLSASQVVDITVAGVNGLDAGVEAANTWYAVYLIGDTTRANPVAGLLSASFSAPTLPAGYNVFRRVGCVRNGAGSDFLRFFQYGNDTVRRYYYDEAQATLQVLTNGSAIVFTAVTLAGLVPPSSGEVLLVVGMRADSAAGAAADVLMLRPTGAVEGTGPMQIRSGVVLASGGLRVSVEAPVSASQQLDYAVTDADDVANIWVVGFDDEI